MSQDLYKRSATVAGIGLTAPSAALATGMGGTFNEGESSSSTSSLLLLLQLEKKGSFGTMRQLE